MRRLLLAGALALLPSLSAVAAENPWVGTWKLDPAKSHLTGETLTFSQGPNGMLRYTDGSAYTYEFRIDGKEYKTFSNRTVSWVAAGDNAWNAVIKQDGAVLGETRREVSADGKTLTVTFKGTAPDGSKINNVLIYDRASGGKGLFGKWKSTKVELSVPDVVVVSSPSPGVLRFEVPAYKFVAEGKTNGTPFVPTGPMAAAGYTISMKAVSPTRLSYENKLNGKRDSYSVQTMAADGKSFTEVAWNAKTPSEKTTSVYVKQ